MRPHPLFLMRGDHVYGSGVNALRQGVVREHASLYAVVRWENGAVEEVEQLMHGLTVIPLHDFWREHPLELCYDCGQPVSTCDCDTVEWDTN